VRSVVRQIARTITVIVVVLLFGVLASAALLARAFDLVVVRLVTELGDIARRKGARGAMVDA
jgi:hypothetical protein